MQLRIPMMPPGVVSLMPARSWPPEMVGQSVAKGAVVPWHDAGQSAIL